MNRQLELQYVSDVHLESKSRNTPDWWKTEITPDAPHLVLAGDIAPARHPELPKFLSWCSSKWRNVVYIPGNHEYWHSSVSIKETEKYLKSLCDQHRVIYAQKRVIQLESDAPLLICCTLWSKLPKDCKNIKSSDFNMIKGLNCQTRSNIYYDHVNFLKNNINAINRPIVVTHHAPISQGTQRTEHIGNRSQAVYVNNLDHLVNRTGAWIFGHTHHVCDIYRRNGVIITSNPIGHSNERLPYNRSAVLTFDY